MRQIRETLRLHLQAKLSYNEVGRTLKISKSVVGKYMSLARVAGVDWNVALTLSDEELQAKLYKAALPRNSKQLLPDVASVHLELKRAASLCNCCGKNTPKTTTWPTSTPAFASNTVNGPWV